MPIPLTAQSVHELTLALENHTLYGDIRNMAQLRRFMEHHIYSVWDFMSLIKYLQGEVAPVRYPWAPPGDPAIRRFINELVLEEESDRDASGGAHFSHFELYLEAMEEIGADTSAMREFLQQLDRGIEAALEYPKIPEPSRRFTRTTFAFIGSGKAHVVAAALALGREHIVPAMFRAILARIGVSESQAPRFHLYLNRHIEIDQDFHGPLSLKLLNALCGNDERKHHEALAAAEDAIRARLDFWDGVHAALRGA